ncbi:MAG: Vps62-related protein, partial [Planctomycetota bacterium]
PQIFDGEASTTTVTYSDVQGGTGEDWFGTGCIDADPLFVDAARGDLRLVSYGPPRVHAGYNSFVTEPNDLAGKARVVDGDEDGTARVDMGAYEYAEYRVHNVTQDVSYITITAAIRDANNRDDEIEVSPGTYPGGINFSGKAVRLYSSGGPDVTTIDGDGAYHVVQCISGEGPNTILEGFTITGGNSSGPDPNDRRGGGVFNFNSSPMVTNCTFTDLWAYDGGAMYNLNSSPTVADCTFSGNSAEYSGGGMYNYQGSPMVADCTFSLNTAGTGGGMVNVDGSNPQVTNCTFSDNAASSSTWGGAGMCNLANSSPTVINCTFTGNTVSSGTDGGGGMGNYNNSSPTVANCILWGDGPDEIYNDGTSSPTVTYSDIEGGWSGEGNIEQNPLLRNVAEGDLSLVPWSDCIDTGNNGVVPPGAADIAGLPRLVDGDCDGTVTVDMGAHELQHTYMGDFDSTCNVDWGDYAVLGWAWLASPLSENWNPACNIGIPADRRIDSLDLKVVAENWLDHADTSIPCDAAVLNHVFGLDPVTIFDILGAAPCSFSPEQIIEEMKQGGCPMLELVEIDADASGQPVIPDGFHALGSYSFTTAGCQFAARELLPGILASPLDYVQVCGTDYWKPVAPPGYVWLGLVESGVEPGLDDVKCVKEQLARPGTLGVEVDPAKADDPNHIIPADTNGVYIGTFGLSGCPQSVPLYVLDARVVQKPEYLTLQEIDQLIQDYGPLLWLYPEEDYFPDDPEWVLDNGVRLEWGLVENDSDYATFTQTDVNSMPTSSMTLMDDVDYVVNSIKPNPPYDSNESFKYWLNIPDALRPGKLLRAKSLVRVVPWNHLMTEIQFWFFYP